LSLQNRDFSFIYDSPLFKTDSHIAHSVLPLFHFAVVRSQQMSVQSYLLTIHDGCHHGVGNTEGGANGFATYWALPSLVEAPTLRPRA
jgi:hypothetical protein